MTGHEALDVVERINEYFPRFSLTESQLETWVASMIDKDADEAMAVVTWFGLHSKTPPTIAELRDELGDGEWDSPAQLMADNRKALGA